MHVHCSNSCSYVHLIMEFYACTTLFYFKIEIIAFMRTNLSHSRFILEAYSNCANLISRLRNGMNMSRERMKIFPQIPLFCYLLPMTSPADSTIQNCVQHWSMTSRRSCCDDIVQGHRSPLAGAFAFAL